MKFAQSPKTREGGASIRRSIGTGRCAIDGYTEKWKHRLW